ncbi:MAG TPA: hybrid sensor histidine kinase/response regulator, partial [Roseiflexaceae bacterium]|nr:hybrid sensor histidine kinase/response regulator [Roseiflexaceae bacterium]
ASSGREALELLLKHDIAVILMDVSMPELDGFELAELIRQHPRYQKTAIIFVSAVHLTDLDRLKGYAAGAVDYVSVPVVPEILRAKVSIFADLYRKTRQLERLNHELEQRVEERTGELSQRAEELQQLNAELARSNQERQELLERERAARAEAEAAVRLREQFLAIASHELKTPLTALIGFGQLMQMRSQRGSGLSERDAQSVKSILAQAERLNRMINALLDVSRIEQGRPRLEYKQVDLNELAHDTIAELHSMYSEQVFEVQVSETPLLIETDPLRLEQVLYNLLGNAMKYSPHNKPITVNITAADEMVSIAIRDRGIGIPEQDLPHLFERFYRASNVSVDNIAGVGIGLYVVQEIVALHHGTVDVESREGHGSTFTICLPRTMPYDTGGDERDGLESSGRTVVA